MIVEAPGMCDIFLICNFERPYYELMTGMDDDGHGRMYFHFPLPNQVSIPSGYR